MCFVKIETLMTFLGLKIGKSLKVVKINWGGSVLVAPSLIVWAVGINYYHKCMYCWYRGIF